MVFLVSVHSERHSLVWWLDCILYSSTDVSFSIIIRLMNVEKRIPPSCLLRPQHDLFFCMKLSSFGTNFSAVQGKPKSLKKMYWTNILTTFKSSAISLMVYLRLRTNISFTLLIFSPVFNVDGLPLQRY